MHSVAGGELGGADDELVGVARYLVPFQTTSFPSTVRRDSRNVLCLAVLGPPRLLVESRLFEHSAAGSSSSHDVGKFTTTWVAADCPRSSCSRNCCIGGGLFLLFRRFRFFLRLPVLVVVTIVACWLPPTAIPLSSTPTSSSLTLTVKGDY